MDGLPAHGWEDELERWLAPFLARLRRQAQRRWAPLYLKGLLLPGERKSIEPMAARVVMGRRRLGVRGHSSRDGSTASALQGDARGCHV